jgi:4'-phosphopantetheinyl transferase
MSEVFWLACGENEPPQADEWLSDRDRRRLASMKYAKRYEEARLSRWTAQRAVALASGLADTTESAGRIEVGNHPGGAPYARSPAGDVVSISSTDRAGWAVTMVRVGSEAIGCDLELVEPRSPTFVRDYFTPVEQQTVTRFAAGSDLIANLIWSAKESALKVLKTGLRRDTRTVEVTLDSGHDGWQALSVLVDGHRTLPGWWRRFDPFLLSVVASAEISPPSSLVEPSPLAGATPSHSWMERPIRLG